MNDLSKVSILLTNGEDPNKLNEEGLSALHIAVLKENKNMIYLLLKNGANPNIQSTNTQQTCLHFAYQQRNSEEIVNLLIKYNADMNILDIYNKKPKEYAQSVLQSSENITNTYQENTFTLENHLDSFITSNKGDISKNNIGRDYNDNNIHNTSSNKLVINTNTSNTNIFSELQNGSEEPSNTIQTPKREINYEDDENLSLNDSLEDSNELAYSKSKSYYVSDLPVSTMKNENAEEHKNSEEEISTINIRNQSIIDNQNEQKNVENDKMYKKLIIAKRLNFCNNRLSYHNKEKSTSSNNHHLIEAFNTAKQHKLWKTNVDLMNLNNNEENESINNISQNISDRINQNNILNNKTCIHNIQTKNNNQIITPFINNNPNKLSSYLSSTINNLSDKQNLTEIELEDSICNKKPNARPLSVSPCLNYFSCYSTQFQSNKQYSNRSKKKCLGSTFDHDINNTNEITDNTFGRVSEFTINKEKSSKYNPNLINDQDTFQIKDCMVSRKEIEMMSKWLDSFNMKKYLNLFVDNYLTNIQNIINSMKNTETKLRYEDLENIGIKKSGDIYRILIKLEMDAGLIQESICQFILPNTKINNLNDTTFINSNQNINLKISNEYCCGCFSAKNIDNKKDLKSWLRKNNIFHLYANFIHNGFDSLDYVMIQMYSTTPFNNDILENCLHIYEEGERTVLLNCLVDEMKKINGFIKSNDFLNNPYNYKYSNVDIDKEEDLKKKENCGCYVF